jgi:hypothetical protein
MVGSSGTIQNKGTLKSKNGRLNDKIVNGQVSQNFLDENESLPRWNIAF